MSEETIDRLRSGYESLAAGDMETVLQLVSPEMEVHVHTERPDMPDAGVFLGRDGFAANLDQLKEAFDDFQVEPEEFIEAGDRIVVQIRVRGRGKGSGVEVETGLVHVWALRDDQAVRLDVYRDMDEARAALEL